MCNKIGGPTRACAYARCSWEDALWVVCPRVQEKMGGPWPPWPPPFLRLWQLLYSQRERQSVGSLPHYLLAAAACLCYSQLSSAVPLIYSLSVSTSLREKLHKFYNWPSLMLDRCLLLLRMVSTWDNLHALGVLVYYLCLYDEPCIYNFLFWTPFLICFFGMKHAGD